MLGADKVEQLVCISLEDLCQIHVPDEIQDTGTFYALKYPFLTLIPHSMAKERTVSCYNNIITSGRAS